MTTSFVVLQINITHNDNMLSAHLNFIVELTDDTLDFIDLEFAQKQAIVDDAKTVYNTNRLWWLLVLALPLAILVFWLRKKKTV
ncbi:MAG: hypothetical protein JJE03_07900 [Peptostreptococcaceae bacterium]|nr:hypothetical protein [Peptostreptococcaceae bacterium]